MDDTKWCRCCNAWQGWQWFDGRWQLEKLTGGPASTFMWPVAFEMNDFSSLSI
jgi:hypothetical protein